MENLTNGNVNTLAGTDESSHVLSLDSINWFPTLVVSRGTTPDRNRTLTQRVVLSLVSAVYDPIGLVAPCNVKTRLLLIYIIWRLSVQQWDDNLPDHIVDNFIEWIDKLTMLIEITIHRKTFNGQEVKLELRIFGESCQDVFLSVAFLRGEGTKGSSRTCFCVRESPRFAKETLDNTQT